MTDSQDAAYWKGAYERMSARNIEQAAQIADLETRKAEVHALHERTERNRDMWKGQVERQAADLADIRQKLEQAQEALRRQVENIERWIETGEPAGSEESKSIYEQLRAALGGPAHG